MAVAVRRPANIARQLRHLKARRAAQVICISQTGQQSRVINGVVLLGGGKNPLISFADKWRNSSDQQKHLGAL